MSSKQIQRQDKWDAENTVRVSLKLNRRTDADILAVLEGGSSKQATIKELIREALKRRG